MRMTQYSPNESQSRIAKVADNEMLIMNFLGILFQPALRNLAASFVEAMRTTDQDSDGALGMTRT
jgi:hypothetical protein